MTRLALLADIHGNLPALEAVIQDMAQFNVDHVVVAGDSINCGPFSREVLETITARCWAVVRGNNAFYALDYGTCRAPEHWSAFTLPPFLREQLGHRWLNVLASLPDTLQLRFLDAAPARLFHGTPGNPWVAITPLSTADQISAWLGEIGENTIICAHSHIPMERHVGPWHILNPGSVGMPLDGDPRASYMIVEGGPQGWALLRHRRVSYDASPIFEAFERLRYVERCGITARLLVEEFREARLRLYPYMIWKQQQFPDELESEELFEAFLALENLTEFMPIEYRKLDNSLHRD